MKIPKNKAFTLVELLVVITILSIISVVAYKNFWWAINKASSVRKVSDVVAIDSALLQYSTEEHYFPAVGLQSSTNLWGYSGSADASASNRLDLTYNGSEIETLNPANTFGWWKVYGSWSWARTNTSGAQQNTRRQIWAKGTISQAIVGKKFLTTDLYDIEVWDLKEASTKKKLLEYWVWRYTYAVFRKPTNNEWWDNKSWTHYNIAYTLKDEDTGEYITRIVGNYDASACNKSSNLCPDTLIWNQSNYLIDGQMQWTNRDGTALTNFESTQANQGIPYPVE